MTMYAMDELIKNYLAAYNAMNVPAMLALLHEVIVFEHVSNSSGTIVTSGKAEFESLARQSLTLFTARKQTIRSLTLGGRTAAVEIEFEGTLAIDGPAGLKAGQVLSLRGVTIFAFSDGKIARISDYS